MKFDYSNLSHTAARMIERFGMSAQILRSGEETGPEYAPEIGPDQNHPCQLVQHHYSAMERDGTQVQYGDERYLVSAKGLDFSPDISDRLLVEGRELAIIRVEPLAPAGVVLYYDIQARLHGSRG